MLVIKAPWPARATCCNRPVRPLLELVAVAKRCGATETLRGVELALHAGDVVGLCGDRGAGKSTLLEILAGASLKVPG